MTSVNSNFLKLQSNYLFAEIARKVASFKEANPEKRVISLGIGDVTRPLVPAVVAALHKAVDDMGDDCRDLCNCPLLLAGQLCLRDGDVCGGGRAIVPAFHPLCYLA